MDNRLTLAVAGAGKTRQLAEHCARLPERTRILAITYTQLNQLELRSRIEKSMGARRRAQVVGWFTFLLRDFARPFLPFKFPDKRIRGFNFDGRPSRYARGADRFLDGSSAAYRCELARLAYELTDLSGGALRRRLECCYDEILIDEVQDLAGWDWDVLDFLMATGIPTTMVGDFRQRVISTNPRGSKNKQLANTGAVNWLRKREERGLLSIEESTATWRCQPEIARFADTIHASTGEFGLTASNNRQCTEHDGVYWLHPDQVEDYVAKFRPQCLRDSKNSGTQFDLDYINFGKAKGTSYRRVLIVPTRPIVQFIQGGEPLKPTSAAKFYVAVTRAFQSVAIVLDSAGDSGLPRWEAEPDRRSGRGRSRG